MNCCRALAASNNLNVQSQVIYVMPLHKPLYSALVLKRAATSFCRAAQDRAVAPIFFNQPLIDSLVESSPSSSATRYEMKTSGSPGSPYLNRKCLLFNLCSICHCTATLYLPLDSQRTLQVYTWSRLDQRR